MTQKRFFIKTISSPVSALIFTMGAAFGMMSDAQATPSIASANGTSDCTACHAGGITNKTTGRAGISAFCKSMYPAGTGAYSSNFVCTAVATPSPTPVPPTPTPTPTPTPVPPAPTACSTTEDGDEGEHNSNVAPTLTAPNTVSVHAGDKLTLAVTAFDCADRSITIKATKGLPKGATIANSIDPLLQMPKAVITWTPAVNAKLQTIKVTLVAFASGDNHEKVSSDPKTVSIQVLPAAQAAPVGDLGSIVTINTIGSARYNTKTKKVELSGQVSWAKTSSKQDRQAAIAAETAVITDATTNARLGTAPVSIDGKWKTTIPTNKSSAPCSVDVTFQGKTGAKAVNGAKNCQ